MRMAPADFVRYGGVMQKKPFTELGLSPEVLKAVERMGFEEATPIQTAAIPVLLGGRDLVGQSQTGSGKTAAFAIPAIEKVDAASREVQALMLCPTRELAMQVAEEVAKLAAFKRGVRELPIYGGASYERQFRGLREGVQIVIGTPGRVIDHLDRGSLGLDQLKLVVLDECDRMLDMGFAEDIERILSSAPPERQTAFFSATLPKQIRHLIEKFSRDPEHLKIEAATVSAPAIDQVYYEVERRSKLEVLCRLIDIQDVKVGIIFCATKMMCDELTDHLLARGYSADKLHGDMSQQMRERTMARFRESKVELLIATDVAARGLDVDDVEVVFNYDLPQDAEDYVHRIGRTGRAGRSGRAITFVAGREIWKLQQIQRYTRGNIRREKVPTLDELAEKRSATFIESLRETLDKAEYKRYEMVVDQLLASGFSATDIASAAMHLLAIETAREPQKILEDDPRAERPERGERKPYPKYEAKFRGEPAARGEPWGGRPSGQSDRPPRPFREKPQRDGPPRGPSPEERPAFARKPFPGKARPGKGHGRETFSERPERPEKKSDFGKKPFPKKPFAAGPRPFYESVARKRKVD
jgi:ATP-dependent RNA helicase DeaD